jgi:hypothetical protein
MSQLKAAFLRAGYESPQDRLRALAIMAMSDNASSNERVKAAIIAAVRHDLALTWALFEDYAQMAAGKYVIALQHAMRQAEKAREAGQSKDETQRAGAPAVRGGGQPDRPCPSPAPITPEQREAKKRTAEIYRLSLLETFTIDGSAIGDWQAGEARAWARRTGRHVRFVELLTANMPADDPIRRWITPDEAAAAWQRSGEGA